MRICLSPSDSADYQMLKKELVNALDTLTDRERKVIELRFGLIDGQARTLEEVGKEFKVTRERIRQIEAKALRKLRHPSRSRKLKVSFRSNRDCFSAADERDCGKAVYNDEIYIECCICRRFQIWMPTMQHFFCESTRVMS